MRRLALAASLALAVASPMSVSSATSQARPLSIWPLGDSITAGSIGPSTGLAAGYRPFLDAALESAHVEHRFVGTLTLNSMPTLEARGQQHHDGHSGFLIAEDDAGLDGLIPSRPGTPGFWLRGLDPDVVVIHLGTNDVTHGTDPGVRYPTANGKVDAHDARQRATYVSHLTSRLQHLVDKLHRSRPRTRIVLATIVPIGHDQCDAITPDYAWSVRQLVDRERSQGLRIDLADVFSAFTYTRSDGSCGVGPNLLSADGVHPTSLGYSVMARVLTASIARLTG